MVLTLLHTAEAHRATFEALRDRIAPAVPVLAAPELALRAGLDVF